MSKRFLQRAIVLLTLAAFANIVCADSFPVSNIEFEGLQRIKPTTALSYVDVTPGHTFNTDQSAKIIRSLYATNFFSNVAVGRRGNTLVIQVTERPTIAKIKVSGYETIDKDKVNEVLKTAGLIEGREFDQATLDKFKDSLQQQYYQVGHYNAHVTSVVSKPDARNRVNVTVTVSEGRAAKVEQIQIIGNKAFTEKQILKDVTLTTPGILTFFTKDDQYSREKFDKAQTEIIDFYQNHGYLHAKVDAAQAQLAPDRNDIYVTFKVTEGDQYKVSQIQVLGKTILPMIELQKMIKLKSGDVFSKEKVTQTQKAMTDALGDRGYAFANINVVPKLDESNKTVALTFFVDPGQKVYIRKIHFSGNNQTSDIVLRREARQLEGSLSSTKDIKETERRIKNLGQYIQDAKSKTTPVPGKPDQVDLDFNISESPPATAVGQLSYGTDGFGYGASLNNYNLLGTGKALSLAFNKTPYVSTYSATYLNPYYTFDGISRSINAYAQNFNPGAVNIANYSYQTYGAAVNYGVPISAKNDQITFGGGLENEKVGVGNAPSQQVLDFFNHFNTPTTNSLEFNQFIVNTGWNRNGLDRLVFPTQGLNQNANLQVSLPLGQKKMDFYKVGYNAHWYHPIVRDFVFSALAGAGYGNGFSGTGNLPFFQNYFSGGMGSVRGYETNTLGPKDSLGNSFGGNMALNGTIELIFPNFISPNNLRTSWFVDGGNVYNTHAANAITVGVSNPHAGPIRYSTGLAVEWRIPIVGLVNVSMAEPLNARRGDDKAFFQFSFGTQF